MDGVGFRLCAVEVAEDSEEGGPFPVDDVVVFPAMRGKYDPLDA